MIPEKMQKIIKELLAEMKDQDHLLADKRKRDLATGKRERVDIEQTADTSTRSSPSILDDALKRMDKLLDAANEGLELSNAKDEAKLRKLRANPVLSIKSVHADLHQYLQELSNLYDSLRQLHRGPALDTKAMKEGIKAVDDKITDFKAHMIIVSTQCKQSKDAKFIANEKSDILTMIMRYQKICERYDRQNRIAGHFKSVQQASSTKDEKSTASHADTKTSSLKSTRK
jgi:hypothetical protein